MSSIAVPSRRGERESRFWVPDGSDVQIGTIGPAFEAPPGWFRRTLRGLRKAMLYVFLGMVLAVAAIILLAVVLDAILHIWLLPIVIAWQAVRGKRKTVPTAADDPMGRVIRGGCSRTHRE